MVMEFVWGVYQSLIELISDCSCFVTKSVFGTYQSLIELISDSPMTEFTRSTI